jgi:hypothetical protein
MRRILLLTVVALVMATMMMAMAMPAFAAKGGNGGGATVEKFDSCTVTTPSGGTTSGTGHVVITPNGDQKYKCNTKSLRQ